MEQLAALLLADPRAVIESGIMIPCSLLAILVTEDDENFTTVLAPEALRRNAS